ncbi:MAG TPA: hypothetical protein DCS93_44590 [Microscillaceae bacterium]|nr:hypothetical protein [Microscillaceae bacterium]
MKPFLVCIACSLFALRASGQISFAQQQKFNQYIEFNDRIATASLDIIRCLSSYYQRTQKYKASPRTYSYSRIKAPTCSWSQAKVKSQYQKALNGGIPSLNTEVQALWSLLKQLNTQEKDLKAYCAAKTYTQDNFAHSDQVMAVIQKILDQLQVQSIKFQQKVIDLAKLRYNAPNPYQKLARGMAQVLDVESKLATQVKLSLHTSYPANPSEVLLMQNIKQLNDLLLKLIGQNKQSVQGIAWEAYVNFVREVEKLLDSRRRQWDVSTNSDKKSSYHNRLFASHDLLINSYNRFVKHSQRAQVYLLNYSRTALRFTLKKAGNSLSFPNLLKFQDHAIPDLSLMKHSQPMEHQAMDVLNDYVVCINKCIIKNDRLIQTLTQYHSRIQQIEQAKKDSVNPNKRQLDYPTYFSHDYFYPKSSFYSVLNQRYVLPMPYQTLLNAQIRQIEDIVKEITGLGYQLDTYLKNKSYVSDNFAQSKKILARYQYLYRIFDKKRHMLATNIQKIHRAYPPDKKTVFVSASKQHLLKALALGKPIIDATRKFLKKDFKTLLNEHLADSLVHAFTSSQVPETQKNYTLRETMRLITSFVQAAESITKAKGKYRISHHTIQDVYDKYNALIKRYNNVIRMAKYPLLKKVRYPKVLSFERTEYTPCDCGDGTETIDMTSMEGFAYNNFVLLLDLSESMEEELPTLKNALKYLVNIMRPEDKITIVGFTSQASLMLRPTSAKKKVQIIQAINTLKTSGKTNGEAGIRMAYEWIGNYYKSSRNNKIILATDGIFSISQPTYDMIQKKAGEEVSLSVFSFANQLKAYEKLKKLVTLGRGSYEVVSAGNITYKMVREAQSKKMAKQKRRRKQKNAIPHVNKRPCDCNSTKINKIKPPVSKKTTTYQGGVNMTSMQGFAPNNLMLLLDVSGSMRDKNKLPLLKQSFKYLVNIMRPEDEVSIVVYAGDAAIVLEPTSATNQEQINTVIDQLRSSGKTNVKAGFKLAYKWMNKNYKENGNNRIILATDGEFPINNYIYKLVEKRAEKGIYLSVFSFGNSDKKYQSLQQLVEKGKGNYEHIDPNNANYKLVKEAQSTRVK